VASENDPLETLPSPPAAWDLARGTLPHRAIFLAIRRECYGGEMSSGKKKKSSRFAQGIRKRALSYPQAHEDFPWGESALGEPPRLPIPA
jgi:hypothetical protein